MKENLINLDAFSKPREKKKNDTDHQELMELIVSSSLENNPNSNWILEVKTGIANTYFRRILEKNMSSNSSAGIFNRYITTLFIGLYIYEGILNS